jgi:superfamily II DNA helicase RecQ
LLEKIQGFDVANIRFILKLGVPKTMFEDDQRGGRGGRDGLLCLVLIIAERWALDNLSADPDHKKSKKEERTEQAVIVYTHSKSCMRRQLASLNHDNTPEGKTSKCIPEKSLIRCSAAIRQVLLRQLPRL